MVAPSGINGKIPECVSRSTEPTVDRSAHSDLNFRDIHVSEANLHDGVFENKSACSSLIKFLEASLSNCQQSELHYSKVRFPEKLIKRLAEDVVRLSSDEPCGLRGCVIRVILELQNMCKKLDPIVFDTSVAPTFELILLLKQDLGAWSKLRNLVLKRTCSIFGVPQVLRLEPSFRLLKRKLYSSSSGLFIECSKM